MKSKIQSVVTALFSSLWIVAFYRGGVKCLLAARHQDEGLRAQVDGWLDSATRDFKIGALWLLAVVFFWAFRLSQDRGRIPASHPGETSSSPNAGSGSLHQHR
jgi:hypothetical protein